jgi:Predicted Zn-dependent proteases and their inactivated homologs
MNNKDRNRVETALEIAKACGAQQARATLDRERENSITVLDGVVDKVMESDSSTLEIQLFIDGRYGSFTTNMMKTDTLRKFISNAAQATRLLAPDPCRSLPDKSLYYNGPLDDMGQYDHAVETLPVEEKRRIALGICEEICGRHENLLSVESEYGDLLGETTMADSQGFFGYQRQSGLTASAQCSVRGIGDEKPESFWYERSLGLGGFNWAGVGETAYRRATDSVGARRTRSGKYTMILENTVASKIVAPILNAIAGPSLQQKRSFLLESKGKKIFPDCVTILDRPHIYGSFGARLFDSDGLATKDLDIIREGVVNEYFISDYYGKKMGIPATVDGPSFLKFGEIQGKELSLENIMGKVGDGMLVTGFNGGNCNQATGDFSYGVKGFLVKNGRKVCPISGMNITGNIVRLWQNVVAIGSDPRRDSRWQIPTLAFADVDFSGM